MTTPHGFIVLTLSGTTLDGAKLRIPYADMMYVSTNYGTTMLERLGTPSAALSGIEPLTVTETPDQIDALIVAAQGRSGDLLEFDRDGMLAMLDEYAKIPHASVDAARAFNRLFVDQLLAQLAALTAAGRVG